jgi:SAM-dependent methyltransferase
MLAVLARNNPDARRHQSDSTSIPVEDGSLDAVLVADAWHWFDAEATTAELRRVLKPGGWLGLVWNVVSAPVEPWEFELAGTSDKQYDRDTKGSAAGIKQQRLPYLPDGWTVAGLVTSLLPALEWPRQSYSRPRGCVTTPSPAGCFSA